MQKIGTKRKSLGLWQTPHRCVIARDLFIVLGLKYCVAATENLTNSHAGSFSRSGHFYDRNNSPGQDETREDRESCQRNWCARVVQKV